GGVDNVQSKSFGNRIDRKFRSAINIPLGIDFMSGNGTDIDDMSAPSGDHTRNDLSRYIEQAFDVRVQHFFPVLEGSILKCIEPTRKSCIVDENIDLLPCFGQR